jgi:hypothetical protein
MIFLEDSPEVIIVINPKSPLMLRKVMVYCFQCGFEMDGWYCPKCNGAYQYPDRDLVSEAAQELRRNFVTLFYLPRGHPHLGHAASAFLEAASCCFYQQYLATAVLSRVALESALFSVRITKVHEYSAEIDGTILDLLPDIYFRWDRLLKWVKRNRLISVEYLAKAQRVRQLGNFGAHLNEQIMREAAAHPDRSYSVWISPEDAYWTLNTTSEILLQLANVRLNDN